MTNQKIMMIWAFLYGACGALGFIPEPVGALSGLMIVLSVAFFVPPAVLVFRSVKNKDFVLLAKIRYISLIWLALTMAMIILNFLSVEASEAAGKVLYWMLILVSSPMVCSQMWVVPIFLWGCLLTVCLQHREKKGK